MIDGANNNDRYKRLLLERIGNLSSQAEELNHHRYAALDKTICLLKQAYEASLQADHQAMANLLVQLWRITAIVEDLGCQEQACRLLPEDRLCLRSPDHRFDRLRALPRCCDSSQEILRIIF